MNSFRRRSEDELQELIAQADEIHTRIVDEIRGVINLLARLEAQEQEIEEIKAGLKRARSRQTKRRLFWKRWLFRTGGHEEEDKQI